VANATPRPLYPPERPGTHCIGRWVGSRTGTDGCGKSPLPGFDPRTAQPIRVCITTTLSRPQIKCRRKQKTREEEPICLLNLKYSELQIIRKLKRRKDQNNTKCKSLVQPHESPYVINYDVYSKAGFQKNSIFFSENKLILYRRYIDECIFKTLGMC